ncbi:DUF1624 domain-containing protein [Actinotalea sp. BY-33]|uniref:DUF1624 domain-containing protein n=1 Tax=Actinotalea soli TaxID=2819234 RepID=A0A939LQJ4_9CELL|nr:heparan-alpha-glucosaminide N-acetyltransferase domain-containing protein [Actinotalea soli]MBO1750765.1 DUF1624 domain-containing protein [Actinotalea soli]
MQRVVGADVARGLAVLGMFAAHVGDEDERFWTATGWLQVVDGRSAATFALLAGLSAALLSGGPVPAEGARRRHARVRILVRALMLIPLGALLIALGTPVAVILPGYAVMFALMIPVLGWRPPSLLLLAAVPTLVGPLVVEAVREARRGDPFAAGLPQPVDVVVGEYYPAAVWTAYLLVGLALGRLDLTDRALPRRLALVGAALAAVGHGTSAVALRVLDPEQRTLRALLTSEPHADTTPEVVGNLGAVLLVLAASLLAARYAPRLVTPVAATGALALTAYTGHIMVIAVLGDEVVREPSNLVLAAFVLAALGLTTLWRLALGRGPLENLLSLASTWTADTLVPTGRRGAPGAGPATADARREDQALRPGPGPGRAAP